MKKLMIAISIFLLSINAFANTTDWKEIKQKDGITIYKAKISGSKIVAFKGKVIINAPVKKLIWVLADRDHRHDWVDRLDINQELEVLNNNERIIYQSFKMP